MLKPIASKADMLLDTSRTNMHQLRDLVQKRIGKHRSNPTMSILFESFGFKHGIPVEADFVFDVRCLPNPHWEPQLRSKTGKDSAKSPTLSGKPLEVNRMFNENKGFSGILAAAFCRRQAQLHDHRHRLHRRTAPLGLFCRTSVGILSPPTAPGTDPARELDMSVHS
jgi:RNase adaptor protein for sRNA GlmZ degradation